MKKSSLLLSFTFFICFSHAENHSLKKTKDTFSSVEEEKWENPYHLINVKIAPVFGKKKLNGQVFSLELGAASTNISLKYFKGMGASETTHPVPKYYKLEVQPRFWIGRFMQGPFISPMMSVFDNGEFAMGVAIGFQQIITHRFLIEFFTATQSKTSLEDSDAPFIFRLGFNVGYRFYIKHQDEK